MARGTCSSRELMRGKAGMMRKSYATFNLIIIDFLFISFTFRKSSAFMWLALKNVNFAWMVVSIVNLGLEINEVGHLIFKN